MTFKHGKSSGRHACFGRVRGAEVLATVVGRAEPHNLRIGHPSQHRVLSVREMARAQVGGGEAGGQGVGVGWGACVCVGGGGGGVISFLPGLGGSRAGGTAALKKKGKTQQHFLHMAAGGSRIPSREGICGCRSIEVLPCLSLPLPSLPLPPSSAPAQGFPDHHVICGEVGPNSRGWVRNSGVKQRYQQMGNAVSPAVSMALCRCLALAAVGESPVGEAVIAVPDPAYAKVSSEGGGRRVVVVVVVVVVAGDQGRRRAQWAQGEDRRWLEEEGWDRELCAAAGLPAREAPSHPL